MRSSIELTSRMPAPAEPPTPCTSPMPNAASGVRPSASSAMRVRVLAPMAALVRVRVRVDDVAVAVRVDVEVAAPPAHQQPDREADDQQPDRDLRHLLDALGQRVAPEHERQPERQQRQRVAGAPREPEPYGGAPAAARARRGRARDRGEVVGVGRMAQPEQQRDEQGDGEAALRAPSSAIRSSSPNTGQPFAMVAAATAAWPKAIPPSFAGSRRGHEHAQPGCREPRRGALEQHDGSGTRRPRARRCRARGSAATRAHAAAVASASPWWKRAAIRPVATPAADVCGRGGDGRARVEHERAAALGDGQRVAAALGGVAGGLELDRGLPLVA